MKGIDNRIARKEYLPMPEEARQKFERFRKDFGTKEVKDSLIKDFATGVISGAISAPLIALGPLGAMAAPSVTNAVGRVRSVQVLSDEPSVFLARHRGGSRPRSDDPGFFTYMVGTLITAIGVSLIGTPVAGISPILIGMGTGLLGTGAIAGEAKAQESRNRNSRE